MKSSHSLFGIVLVLGYVLCSVFAYITVKYVFLIAPSILPINVIFWGLFEVMIFTGILIGSRSKERKRVQKEWHEHKKLLIAISLMSALGAILWVWSLKLISAGTVGLIGRADVLITLALGVFFLGEKFSWKSIIGAIIAIGGLCLVANVPNEISLFVISIVLLTRFLYAMQSFLVKKSGQTIKVIPFTFLRLTIMTACLFFVSIILGILKIPSLEILVLLFCSQIFGVYIGRIFYFKAHKYLGIGHINLLSLSQPVLLLIGTWLLFNEPMPFQKIIGGGILLLGLTIILLEKWKYNQKRFSLKRIFATLRAKKDVIENPVDLK